MRWVKLIALGLLWAGFFVAIALVQLGISVLRIPGRWRIVSRVARPLACALRVILNVRVTVEGNRGRLSRGGHVIISNHLGYLDGIVLGSLFPLIYVSKKEVRKWPVIGAWTALCGQIFIDRERREKVPLLVEEIVKKLKQKANVLIFPEGTSTNGETLLPFQSVPFAAPLRIQAPIVPVSLTYKRIDNQPVSASNRDQIYWYGDMEFAVHFWNLLALRNIEVVVKIHPTIETSIYKNNSLGRKQVTHAAYEMIKTGLDLDVGDRTAKTPGRALRRPQLTSR